MFEKVKENFLNALEVVGGYGYFVTIYLASFTSQYIIYRHVGIESFKEKFEILFLLGSRRYSLSQPKHYQYM